MPIALSILREDVGAGDDYDGQLLAAVSALGHDDWSQLIIEREQIIQIIGKAEKLPNMSMEQLKDITKIKAVL